VERLTGRTTSTAYAAATPVVPRRLQPRLKSLTGHLGELTQVVPFDLVDEALARVSGQQRRVRRLPSRVVVYLLLAGALFTSMGWAQVWAGLTASLPAGAVFGSDSTGELTYAQDLATTGARSCG
jgi:hypothetical protein